jgi:hypothetical protein
MCGILFCHVSGEKVWDAHRSGETEEGKGRV